MKGVLRLLDSKRGEVNGVINFLLSYMPLFSREKYFRSMTLSKNLSNLTASVVPACMLLVSRQLRQISSALISSA